MPAESKSQVSGQPTPDRVIRVFISSTFRDMIVEREYLAKFVFPTIRKLCEERGASFALVDLRWGVTDEQKAEGKVLPACLDEIHRCRPYFIGLLGERYGWIPQPEKIPQELINREPWLREQLQSKSSVTELEIIHGVLREAHVRGHRYFYFRDTGYLDRLPIGSDRADFETESPEARAKLSRLKQLIRSSSEQAVCRLRENYRDPQQLAEWVEADLRVLVDELYPPEEGFDPIASAHSQFAAQRRQLWIGHEAELGQLNDTMNTARAALVTAPSGTGLSSFLANWAAAWRRAHAATLVIEHHVGAHPGATTVNGCSRQLCHALASARGTPEPQAAVENEWPDLFVERLVQAAATGPVLLVVDAADAVQSAMAGLEAEWLPLELPEGVQLVASVSEEHSRFATDRDWPMLRLGGLGTGDRTSLVQRYLSNYGKQLSPDRVRQIVAAPAAANPFYVMLLLEELRQHGNNETLGARLAELLGAPDVFQLSDLIFARCERDYDSVDPGITGGTLSLVATARFGLSESEVCKLIGGERGRLPQLSLSVLQLALRSLLVSRNGLLDFAQREARRAAERRYVPTPEQRRALQRQLADYFLKEPDSGRAAVELPSHLTALEAWDELANWLSRPAAFATAWRISAAEVCKAWETVEGKTPRRAAQACASFPAILRPAVISLLRQLGHWSEALALTRQATDESQAETDPSRRLETLFTIGEIELQAGSYENAEAAFVAAERGAAALQNPRKLMLALHGQAKALGQRIGIGKFTQRRRGAEAADLGRRLRAVRNRAMRTAETSGDAMLRAESLVVWLEEMFALGGTLRQLVWKAMVLHRMVDSGQSSDVADRRDIFRGAGQAIKRSTCDVLERANQIEDAIVRLRLTRHRGLALRAELAVAKARDDGDRLMAALRALWQYAAMHDDLDLLAEVYGEVAERADHDQKLAWLEGQAELLERAGRRAALVSNWWQQAKVLWLNLDRRTEALAMAQRVSRELKRLPRCKQRMHFRFDRIRMHLKLDDERLRTVLRVVIWLVSPFWYWGLWWLVRWTWSWFSQHPVFGVLAYLFELFLGFCLFMLFLEPDITDALRFLQKRLCRGKRAKADTFAEDRPQAQRTFAKPQPVVLSNTWEQLNAAESEISKVEDKALPAVRWFVRQLARARGIGRIQRIGRALGMSPVLTHLVPSVIGLALALIYKWAVGWDLPWTFWLKLLMALLLANIAGLAAVAAFPSLAPLYRAWGGICLVLSYKWAVGWSLPWPLWLKVVTALVLVPTLSAAVGIISSRKARRSSSMPIGINPLGVACALRLIRLKRRLFDRRRKNAGRFH
ncbi:MAG: DUF4062 domain-containing protein [Verrucomicrobia bacterium]|nr:DUF4062 domain-containing protein [Verrucomicrobiota bacterium]